MDASVCPECGRPHDPVARPTRAGRLTALLLAAALLVVAAAAVAALLSDGGDSTEAEPSSTTSTSIPEDAMEEDSDSPATAEAQLAAAGRSELVAYVSGTSVVTIDLASGEVTTTAPEIDTGFSIERVPVDRYELLIAGNRTFGISRANPFDISALTLSGVIVPLDATWVVIVDRQAGESTQLLATHFLQGFSLPLAKLAPDTGHLLVPDLGVLATPRTGGTYLINRETLGRVSEGRVVAATVNDWVEQRCDASLRCSTVVVSQDTGAEIALPTSFNDSGDNLTIAPDGERIVQWGTERSQVYEVRDGSVLVVGAIPIDPYWIDPTTIAWLEIAAEEVAHLAIADVGSDSATRIDLGLLGAPGPTDLGLAFTS